VVGSILPIHCHLSSQARIGYLEELSSQRSRYHTIPYHTIPYHTIPYHTIPYHALFDSDCLIGGFTASLYEFTRPWLGIGLLTAAGDEWKRKRRMITPAFHFGILKRYQTIFAKHIRVLFEKWCEQSTLHIQTNKQTTRQTERERE
jgi:hypothetical protein